MTVGGVLSEAFELSHSAREALNYVTTLLAQE